MKSTIIALMACMTSVAWAAQAAEKAEPLAAENQPYNRIRNGSFEFPPLPGKSSGADFWYNDTSVAANVVASPTAHGGKNVLRISPTAPPQPGAVWQYLDGIKAGERCVLECYARGQGAKLQLFLYKFDPRTLPAGTVPSAAFTLKPEWTLCRLECAATEEFHRQFEVALHVLSGKAEVDDVSLKVMGGEEQEVSAKFLSMAIDGKAAEIPKVEEKPWRGNQLGMSHAIPPPFKPIEVLICGAAGRRGNPGKGRDLSGQDFIVTCWGREYQFAKSPLPSQIVSQGAQLLSAPVRFQARESKAPSAAAPAMCRWSSIALKENDEDKVVFESEGTISTGGKGQLGLGVRTEIEFDGLVRYDLTVRSEQPVSLNRFALEIPLLRATAPLIHYSTLAPFWRQVHFDATPGAPWNSGFSPTVWMGDCKRGLSWFAESPKGWLGPEDRQLELAPQGAAVLFRVNFINQPSILSASTHWTFGLIATPTKPVPETPSNQYVTSFAAGDEPLSAPPGVVGVEYILDRMDSPWRLEEDPLEYYHVGPKMQGTFQERVRSAHGRGHLAIPSIQRRIVGALPGYLDNLPNWLQRPAQVQGTPRLDLFFTCQQSQEWNELLLYALVASAREYGVDGVYFDTGDLAACANPLHGCGYLDPQGRWFTSYPIFAEHEFKKRLYRALYEVTAPRLPYICSLADGRVDIAAYSFDTALVSGEEWSWQVKTDYRTVVSPAQWAAQYNPNQWGLWHVFLPSRTTAGEQDLAATDSFLRFSLLYNTPLWIGLCNEKRVFAALDAVHKLGEHVRFVSPVDVEPLVTLNAPQCKAALYRTDERMLIVLSNFGDASAPVAVSLSPEAVKGLKPELSASDALTAKALALEGNKITVDVPGNSFRMVLIGNR